MEKRRMWTKQEIQFVRENLGPVGSCSTSRRA